LAENVSAVVDDVDPTPVTQTKYLFSITKVTLENHFVFCSPEIATDFYTNPNPNPA